MDEAVYESLEQLLSGLEEGIIVLQTEPPCVLANPAGRHVLGLSPQSGLEEARQALAGIGVLDLVDAAEGERRVQSAGRSLGIEVRRPLPQVTMVVVRDGTDREDIERQKSEFLANTSHELRTPLNAIIGFTELSLDEEDGVLTEGQRHNLERVMANARRLLGLIDDLLDLAKLASISTRVRWVEVDLERLAERCLEDVRPLALMKPISLDLVVPEVLPRLQTDPDKLRKILLNLLSNGVKFTNDGYVRLRLVRDEPDHVRICVEDSGEGIAMERLPHIFDRFRQVDGSMTRRASGMGIGLALVRGLTERIGGEILVESEVGKGSRFDLRLPVETKGGDPKGMDGSGIGAGRGTQPEREQ